MKVEIGESLMYSYLKHVRKCVLGQTNWKPSGQWQRSNTEKVESIFGHVQENFAKFGLEAPVFGNRTLDTVLKQAEIDVVAWDAGDTIYAVEAAYHEGGLNYTGGKEESRSRVVKKLLRAYLALLSYFPGKKYEVWFVTPKASPGTDKLVSESVQGVAGMENLLGVNFRYVSNNDFFTEIVLPTLESTKGESDTNELFVRSAKLLDLFDLIALPSVGLGDCLQETKPATKFILEFVPSDEELFKSKLIASGRAKRTWTYADGTVEQDTWFAGRMTETSHLRGNIFSNNKVRNREELGLVKLRLEIEGFR